MNSEKKLLLIDGNSLINRSFYAIKLLSNKSGVFTNAISGFFTTLLKLRSELNPEYIAVAFDLRKPTFRHKLYDGYKKSRKGMPEELAMQMPYIKEMLDYMGIKRVELAGYEADDLIGTLSKIADCHKIITTGDRDSFQLIAGDVTVALQSTKESVLYTPETISEKYGITPLQFIEIKALMGDTSDDIPGVAGIGEKTAFSLITKYKTVDYIYQNLDSLNIANGVRTKLEKGKDDCFLSRELGIIKIDVPLDTELESYRITVGEAQKLAKMLGELQLQSLARKLKIVPVTTSTIPTSESPNSIENSEIAQDSERIIQLEQDLDGVLRDMERVGIKVDVAGLMQFGKELVPQLETLTKQIHKLAGREFNVASPKQLGELLFTNTADGGLELPHGKKTKTGYSTNIETLESLADKHEIIPLILEYRALSKLNSTYVEGLLKCVNPENSRIHTTYKSETRTGRISSVEPNIQNIPVRTERGRVMRRFFIADEGKVLVDADYSQIELRVLAAISCDKTMLAAFKSGADIHAITASQIFGVEQSLITREMRSASKAVNFGIVYGMGAFSLTKELQALGIPVTNADSKAYIERYLDTYDGVRAYLHDVIQKAKRDGYVKTMLGRVRHVPELQSSNHVTRNAGERIVKNTPIQGTAADIIKIAMLKVNENLAQSGINAKLILQIHDELIVEADASFAEQVAAIVESQMLAAGKEVGIDLAVDVRCGLSWYETH
ncbi:MAG: DNA polymerase [Oscillospiraceae bacterium]|nr:DNA polymerase [Oscillospiraceae bacterium]